MVTAAQELGSKGGKAKSPAKTAAARANAKRPRSKKPIPTMDMAYLLRACVLEFETERKRCELMGERFDCLQINGHDLVDVIKHNMGMA